MTPTHTDEGFTLLEMIIVIVILGIAAAAVVGMVAHVGSRQSENSDLQVGTQLIQECAENIVSQHRRDDNFFNVTSGTGSPNCYSLTAYGGFNTPVVTANAYTGAACPSGATCKELSIALTKGGDTFNPVSVMLIYYN
jgi:prepilin-type N-terminal cleavage/methylation domain-containing protein